MKHVRGRGREKTRKKENTIAQREAIIRFIFARGLDDCTYAAVVRMIEGSKKRKQE